MNQANLIFAPIIGDKYLTRTGRSQMYCSYGCDVTVVDPSKCSIYAHTHTHTHTRAHTDVADKAISRNQAKGQRAPGLTKIYPRIKSQSSMLEVSKLH